MSNQFKENEIVKFENDAKVFDIDNKTEFQVSKGTEARVIIDEDSGSIGSIKLRLTRENGEYVVVETDDKNLKRV